MTNNIELRDHFAGQAMQSIIQSQDFMEAAKLLTEVNKDLEIQEAIGMMAYGMADTMIIERSKKEKENGESK